MLSYRDVANCVHDYFIVDVIFLSTGLQGSCRTSQLPGVEAVRPDSTMSGRQQQQQQQQSASGVGRRRCDGKDHLEAGSSVQDEDSKFECQHCGKTFLSTSQLKRHTLTHTGERKHECLECGKRFAKKSTLTTHTLTHTGERKHECLECGKRFAQKSNLTRHTLTHSSVKNYECLECGKR